MTDQPELSASNAINYASGQHFLAEIKYPNIPDAISIDKIFNVLQKIKTTSKPLFYKWQTIHRPQRKALSCLEFLRNLFSCSSFRRRNIFGAKVSVDAGSRWR